MPGRGRASSVGMNISEVTYAAGTPVEGYGPGFWRVGGREWRGGVLVLPSGPVAWSGEPAPITAAAPMIDVLLLGTGAEIAHPDPALREAVEAAGIGIEVMASAQAARTFNVLLGEGRRVACALLPL